MVRSKDKVRVIRSLEREGFVWHPSNGVHFGHWRNAAGNRALIQEQRDGTHYARVWAW